MSKSLILDLMREIADEMRVDLLIEPTWGYVARLRTPDGRTRFFRNTVLDLNAAGSVEIAKDKDYAAFFLKDAGYPVPEGEAFYTTAWAATIGSDRTPERAQVYAERLGYPVIVKPNSKSQGHGVSLVRSGQEFAAAFAQAAHHERVVLVQKRVMGRDYRIVVLDGVVISAYERRPLQVTGDGIRTVRALLQALQEQFVRDGRDTCLSLDDPRITRELAHRGATQESIPPKGLTWTLLPNANLSSGGMAVDVTERLHSEWCALAARIARDMNLRYIGIDVMTEQGLDAPPQEYVVIEVNAAPGLDNYATIGAIQKQRVKALYRNVMEALLR